MKKTLLISGLFLALTASVASAGGINLNWSNCEIGTVPPPAKALSFACNANTGASFVLMASFDPNVSQQCIAFEYIVDIESSGPTLPAWWDFKNAGSCRSASMSMNTNFGATGPFDCVDPWSGSIGLQDFSYTVVGNTVRIFGFGSAPATNPVPLDAATEYYGFALLINRAKTAGLGACGGCLDQVAIVFNEINLYDETGAPHVMTGPAAVQSNCAAWQGFANPCAATPTTKSTWGKIKSIYR
jgi:hypothetical protein